MSQQLRMLGLATIQSVRTLMTEALTARFVKRGKPHIAQTGR